MILTAAPAVLAVEVQFPLTIDYPVLRAAVKKHLRETADGELTWRSVDGCRTLVMRDPRLEPFEGRLRLSGPATARAGLPLFGYCWGNLEWSGPVEILARPEIGRDWQVRLRDIETQLGEPGAGREGIAGRIWEVVRAWPEAELGAFSYDVGPPVEDLRTLLSGFAGTAGAERLSATLRTLRPLGLAVEPDGLVVRLAVDAPDGVATPRAPEAALTPAEQKRWQSALDHWDGFLVFVVKDLGGVDPAVRTELLDTLIGARHELVSVLGRGPERGVDPVRALFLSTWDRLRGLVRRTAAQAPDESRALRYFLFLGAGDALAAIERAAPAAGLEISSDGLRRLARTLDPAYAGDPLEYSDLPDARLQQIFRFRDPDAPPRRPRRRPAGSWDWLGPRAAHAQGADEWSQLGARLDRWVPQADELGAYRMAVERLLALAADRSMDPDALDERFDRLFTHLVKAVAWQESCWRQFVRRGDRVTYILSSTGDVGMMQINVRIWRGFFNPEKLRWNAAYNVGAGAEILVQLLARYGSRETGGRLENAARSSYSAYNGGPARYRRYRQARSPVDAAFWDKYLAIAGGSAGERVLCLGPRPAPRSPGP
jgi:hypothetical protein